MVNFKVFVFFVCSGVVVGMLRRKSEGGIDGLMSEAWMCRSQSIASGETVGHGHVPYVIVP